MPRLQRPQRGGAQHCPAQCGGQNSQRSGLSLSMALLWIFDPPMTVLSRLVINNRLVTGAVLLTLPSALGESFLETRSGCPHRCQDRVEGEAGDSRFHDGQRNLPYS